MKYLEYLLASISIVVFGGLFIVLSVGVAVLWCLLWALGFPITIKSEGRKIGHYRWFKYYPKWGEHASSRKIK